MKDLIVGLREQQMKIIGEMLGANIQHHMLMF